MFFSTLLSADPQVRLIEGAYVQLEDAYCLRSVEEAMRIAEPIEVRPAAVFFFFFFLSHLFGYAKYPAGTWYPPPHFGRAKRHMVSTTPHFGRAKRYMVATTTLRKGEKMHSSANELYFVLLLCFQASRRHEAEARCDVADTPCYPSPPRGSPVHLWQIPRFGLARLLSVACCSRLECIVLVWSVVLALCIVPPFFFTRRASSAFFVLFLFPGAGWDVRELDGGRCQLSGPQKLAAVSVDSQRASDHGRVQPGDGGRKR